MKGVKVWSWEGDELVAAMIESLGLVSTPLALPDVLSSLSTGVVDAAYAPPLGILALQWQTKVKYLVDFPTAYSIGSVLISNKVWKKISKPHRQAIKKIAAKYIKEANVKSIKANEEGLVTLKKQGVEFIQFSKADIDKAASVRSEVIKKLTGKLFSKTAVDMLNSELKKLNEKAVK